MKQLTANVFVETGLKGANHGLVMTSDGIVLIDTPHKPSDAVRLKGEIERRGRLRYIINTEPHGDHWTGNAFFDVPVVAQRRSEIAHPRHRFGRACCARGLLRTGRAETSGKL